MIGLAVLDVANPFFTDLAAGVEEVAYAAGRIVLLTNSGEDPDREARALSMFEGQRLDGLLVTPVGDDISRFEAVRARGTGVVLIDRLASSPGFSSVAVDDRLGGRLAAEHLLDLGHRRSGSSGRPRRSSRSPTAWPAPGPREGPRRRTPHRARRRRDERAGRRGRR